MMSRRGLALAVAAALSAPAAAQASGFLIARFGGEHGHVTGAHPSAIYYNPAGLALDSGWRLSIEGLVGYMHATYDRPAAAVDRVVAPGETAAGTPEEALAANAGRATLTNAIAIPAFLGVAADLGVPGLGVGAAMYVPFGGRGKWDENAAFAGSHAYPGAVDGVQRWASIEGTSLLAYASLGAAWRVRPLRLSLGAAANLVRTEYSVVTAYNADGNDHLVASTGALQEGRILFEARDTTWSLGLGVIWEPTPGLRLGASYQSQPGFGPMTVAGTFTTKVGGSTPGVTQVELVQELPDVLRVGASWNAPRWHVAYQIEWVRWSLFDRQCFLDRNDPDRACVLTAQGAVDTANGGGGVQANIPRDWHDAFAARVSGGWRAGRRLWLSAGVTYDGSAVPARRLRADLLDAHKLILSAGARHALGGSLMLTATWLQYLFEDRHASPPPRDASGARVGDAPPSRSPDGAGAYHQSAGLLLVGVEARF